MPFSFSPLQIPEVVLIEAQAFADRRGVFLETYKQSDFSEAGINAAFVQDNHSRSRFGVLRGLHYQTTPGAQAKLVMVTSGEIFDVAVDLRPASSTFGEWVGETLSAENHRMLFIPEGFAHGFCVVSGEAHVLYKVTHEYSPAHDRGVRWDDPDIGVAWPIREPVLSPRDANQPALRLADLGLGA